MIIESYDDKYLIEQVKFVNELQKDWIAKEFKQTVKFYRQIFASPSFNSNLNLYAFEDLIESLLEDEFYLEEDQLIEILDEKRLTKIINYLSLC